MQYTSTRDAQVRVQAAEAIATGISHEGGLFVPTALPSLSADFLRQLLDLDYARRAEAILPLFLTDFTAEEIAACAQAAYGAQFDTPAVAPLHDLGDGRYMLELWHGPTCAFKDMALQILPHLMRVSVQKAAPGEQVVILVATSGDTGKAALEGFKDAPDTRIAVFYPADGVSDMQRLQMVTQEGRNVGVCAIRGNFDDAQTGVKALFTDETVINNLKKNGMRFSSANSINWGRLLPQIVYYISAYCDLVRDHGLKMGDPINVTVPTGNFGNILAAYYAREMGLPIAKLICASNQNRVLTDFFESGTYNSDRPFYTTTSPSMDILVSSNLERLLYHLADGDTQEIRRLMQGLKEQRRYTVSDKVKARLDALFAAGCATDADAADTIGRLFAQQGYLCDTHTAVAVHVYDEYRAATGDTTPTVIASTANPYKFAPAILDALGETAPAAPFEQLTALHAKTGAPIPSPLVGLSEKAVRFTDVCTRDTESMRQAVFSLLHIN